MNFTDYCEKNDLSHLLNEWDGEKNEGIDPSAIACDCEQEFFWKCKRGHSYKCKTADRIKHKKCPQCRLRTWIIVLSALLLLSIGGLGISHIYKNTAPPDNDSTVIVPDNLVGDKDGEEAPSESPMPSEEPMPTENPDNEPAEPTEDASTTAAPDETPNASEGGEDYEPDPISENAAAIELYKAHGTDNAPMSYQNMFPGDLVTSFYCLKTYHEGDVEVRFRAIVTEKTKNLDTALKIRVTNLSTDTVLCDDYFANVNEKYFTESLKASSSKETESYYRIDAYLDTSVGNEFQAARLMADFEWSVLDEGGLVKPPKTGDLMNTALWLTLAIASAAVLIYLSVKKRKEVQNA